MIPHYQTTHPQPLDIISTPEHTSRRLSSTGSTRCTTLSGLALTGFPGSQCRASTFLLRQVSMFLDAGVRLHPPRLLCLAAPPVFWPTFDKRQAPANLNDYGGKNADHTASSHWEPFAILMVSSAYLVFPPGSWSPLLAFLHHFKPTFESKPLNNRRKGSRHARIRLGHVFSPAGLHGRGRGLDRAFATAIRDVPSPRSNAAESSEGPFRLTSRPPP